MTIEEFRNFGWKAGMRANSRINGIDIDEEIVSIDFEVQEVETVSAILYPHDIYKVLSPEGTVAWRAK